MIAEHIFRAYDVRGVYRQDIDERVAFVVGKAFAEYLGGSGKVLVGRDVRLSGEPLLKSLAAGLERGGMEVHSAGMAPTPLLYMGVVEGRYDGGVQVTASHNPPEWNGFKLVLGNGETVSEGSGMERLKEIALKIGKEFTEPKTLEPKEVDIVSGYISKIASLVRLRRKTRVAVDFTNGATCNVGKILLESVGCEVLALNDHPDGNFPAHLPEPNHETLKDLATFIRSSDVDFGVGFDGDGDRAVFLDERGNIVEGDTALAVYVMNSEKRGKVVYDVSCSSALEEVIRRAGCEPVLSRVGRAFMLRAVRESNALIGGEKSNHLYFSEIYGFDDGVYAAVRMAEIVSKFDGGLSKIVDEIPRYPSSPIMSLSVPDEKKFRCVEEVRELVKPMAERTIEIDGVKAYLGDGWILVRASNTMPQVKYVAEAKSAERLREYVALAESLIRKALERI